MTASNDTSPSQSGKVLVEIASWPLPLISEVCIPKGFKCGVLEVRIPKGLRGRFVEVRILRDLVAGGVGIGGSGALESWKDGIFEG